MKFLRTAFILMLAVLLCIGTLVACDKDSDSKETPTSAPTTAPTEAPTTAPTEAPTTEPTEAPTTVPTEAPTTAPTEAPTTAPTEAPTTAPTEGPTEGPTEDKYTTITIAEALQICGDEPSDAPTTERYYIRATITEMKNTSYGEMIITDETGSIYVYGTYSADGTLKFNQLAEKPEAGDEILIYATLQNYNGKKEVQNARLIEFTKGEGDQGGSSNNPTDKPADGAEITIAEAIEIANAQGETATTERYIIKATVVSIDKAQYGAMTITDGTGTIAVYGTYSADGSIGYADMTDKPYKGDSVVLSCTLQLFKGTPEVKNARLISFEKAEVDYDENEYTDMSIADARETAVGTKIKVDGVVARITYANGMIPSGVYLVDGTQSIYVYDGDLAQRVQIGNTVTIIGTKDYWILETEQNNAEKFGYKGCCQITDVTLIELDEDIVDFDKTWISESTVKDIVDTPVTEDITSTIFKVTALVKKVPSTGFTNYYFFDLDEKTSSYAYTQCNGGDFAWLDQFDGKICTVYLSALNAKSTASDCYWRFIPVAVIDENFVFDTANAPAFALKYYGMGQSLTEYSADPTLELITSVSSELLKFEGVVLSYASSNEASVYFETVDGKTYMHCGASGEATVTVTATYGQISVSDSYTIKVTAAESYEYVDVKTAIDAELGTEVVVKGIVGPSLVNKTGFYLIDETGLIAIQTTADVMSTLKVGNEVIISGVRTVKTKGGTNYFGQSLIDSAEVVANYYGTHEYADDLFVATTADDFYNLDPLTDYSTTVFVFEATISFTGSGYSTNVGLVGENNTVGLYCSGAGQYEFLRQFDGQKVTLEVAACNWNDKSYWRGCVLSVITEDGKVINELNFNK